MADEPRVARLYLVPVADQAGDGETTPTAEFGDLSTAGTDAGGATADLRMIGRGAGARRPARLAPVEQLDTPAGPDPAAPARRTAELGHMSATEAPSVRVAGLGSAGARRGSHRSEEGADRPRRAGRIGSGPDPRAPEAGRRRAEPPVVERVPSRPVGSNGTAPRDGHLDDRAGDGPGEPPPDSTPSGSGRRRPGPKQIDPAADPVAAAKDICLDLLTVRARTKHELAEALRRRGVPDEATATALDRFDEVGLIDDAAFAGQWVRSRQRTKGLARRALAVELRRKGVDEEIAGEALAEVDASAEEERARELVDRKLRTVPADTPEQRTTAARRLVGMLARKGYGGGIAYRVVREALAAHGADPDELGSEPLDS